MLPGVCTAFVATGEPLVSVHYLVSCHERDLEGSMLRYTGCKAPQSNDSLWLMLLGWFFSAVGETEGLRQAGLCEDACSSIWSLAGCSRLWQVACITKLSNLFSVWSLSVCLVACPSDLLSTTVHVNIVLRFMRTSCILEFLCLFFRSVTLLLIYTIQIVYGELQRCVQSYKPLFVMFTNQQKNLFPAASSSL